MEADKNKNIVRKYFEMWNTGDVNLADEILSPTYLDYAHPEIKGTESVKQSVIKVREMFPDFNIAIDKIIAEKDIVGVFGSVSRTNQNKIEFFKIIWFVTVVDGKMAELWTGNVTLK